MILLTLEITPAEEGINGFADMGFRKRTVFDDIPRGIIGMGSAVQSFVNKLGNALSTSFIIVMYMIVNLNVADISANVTANPLAMSATVRSGMFSLISIIPAVSLLLCTIPLFFYDLVGEKKARVTRELAEQRKEKGVVIH